MLTLTQYLHALRHRVVLTQSVLELDFAEAASPRPAGPTCWLDPTRALPGASAGRWPSLFAMAIRFGSRLGWVVSSDGRDLSHLFPSLLSDRQVRDQSTRRTRRHRTEATRPCHPTELHACRSHLCFSTSSIDPLQVSAPAYTLVGRRDAHATTARTSVDNKPLLTTNRCARELTRLQLVCLCHACLNILQPSPRRLYPSHHAASYRSSIRCTYCYRLGSVSEVCIYGYSSRVVQGRTTTRPLLVYSTSTS